MKTLILWLWQLPQNLVGVAVILCLGAYNHIIFGSPEIYVHEKKGITGVSLGNFIILSVKDCTENTVKHEKGHQKQSLYLGWLYLPLIGLPSVIGNLLHRLIKFDYYKQPWEAWADKLGGVKRY